MLISLSKEVLSLQLQSEMKAYYCKKLEKDKERRNEEGGWGMPIEGRIRVPLL